jgi:tungstate transport system substrate-binding protein
MNRLFAALAAVLTLAMLAGCGGQKANAPKEAALPANPEVILATTTSARDSGLLAVLVPAFEMKTGYKVKTIAVTPGQAIAMGEQGEADVLLTHAPDAEKKAAGAVAVVNRRLVMHNDFLIVGPAADPAKVKGKKAREALEAFAKARTVFVSRGDDSDIHRLEKKLWSQAGIKPAGKWYLAAGAGMGQTLKIASEQNGYTVTDRATYLAHKKNVALVSLVEGDPALLNIYHVMEVNPAKFAKVNKDGAKAFAAFLLSAEGQDMIKAFGREKYGQPLFFADGGKREEDLGN